jgi:hypothetical protein
LYILHVLNVSYKIYGYFKSFYNNKNKENYGPRIRYFYNENFSYKIDLFPKNLPNNEVKKPSVRGVQVSNPSSSKGEGNMQLRCDLGGINFILSSKKAAYRLVPIVSWYRKPDNTHSHGLAVSCFYYYFKEILKYKAASII